jgi:hypothetical protein
MGIALAVSFVFALRHPGRHAFPSPAAQAIPASDSSVTTD